MQRQRIMKTGFNSPLIEKSAQWVAAGITDDINMPDGITLRRDLRTNDFFLGLQQFVVERGRVSSFLIPLVQMLQTDGKLSGL